MTTRRKFVLSLALGGFAAMALPTVCISQELAKVRIGVDPYTTGSQIWVAHEAGFFAANGVAAEISVYATGIETLDATLTGNADVGVGLDFPIALRMQSRQLTVLAAIFASKPGWHKLAVSEAIKADADLKGKSFGIATGTAQNLVTVKYLEAKGLSANDYTLVPFSNLVEIVSSLKAGRIDAAFVWADGVAQAKETPGITIMTDDSEAGLKQSAYVSSNSSFAKDNRAALVGVLRAMNEASAFIATDPAAAAAMIAKNTKAPPENVEKLLKLNTFKVGLTNDDRENFADIAEFASTVIKTPVTFDTAVDPSYLSEAVPANVTLSK